MSAQIDLRKVLTDGPEEVRAFVSQICDLLPVSISDLEKILQSVGFNVWPRSSGIGGALAESLRDGIDCDLIASDDIRVECNRCFDKSRLCMTSKALLLAELFAKVVLFREVRVPLSTEIQRQMAEYGEPSDTTQIQHQLWNEARLYLAQDPNWWNLPEFQELVNKAKRCFPIIDLALEGVLVSSAIYVARDSQDVRMAIRRAIGGEISNEVIDPFDPRVAPLIERFDGRIKDQEQESCLIDAIANMLRMPQIIHNVSVIATRYVPEVSFSEIQTAVNVRLKR